MVHTFGEGGGIIKTESGPLMYSTSRNYNDSSMFIFSHVSATLCVIFGWILIATLLSCINYRYSTPGRSIFTSLNPEHILYMSSYTTVVYKNNI